MNELIDRQNVLDIIDDAYKRIWELHATAEETLDFVKGKIEGLTKQESTERKHGQWVKISSAGIYECTLCGKMVMPTELASYPFCHGCGADMRGETNG